MNRRHWTTDRNQFRCCGQHPGRNGRLSHRKPGA
jgi:hypothetical protein